jgi:radical SAM superfamily enzyme YgiQ (UPF0313 family)
MSKSIYLINPRGDYPTYFTAEVYTSKGFKPTSLVADLAIPTLAALAPNDFHVEACDENISPVDFDINTDFVGITGKLSQRRRMISIAKEFRRRGKVVLIGGPYASLSPEHLRPHCDILVQGEVENIASDLFSDLKCGRWKQEYVGDKPDLSNSPLPKWSVYPNNRTLTGSVQTSRGCPFECEFCDVIQYLGRKQRRKTPSQVISELEVLDQQGYQNVFLSDDNFTAARPRAKELLAALKDWNQARKNRRMSFITQLSIEVSKDSELLHLCADAGLNSVFIGIETPNEASLKETKKYQNMGSSLVEQVERFIEHGIAVTAGMIVGFDSDDKDIFERQYEFAMSTPIPIFTAVALVAPMATPLYARMAKENRLLDDGTEVAMMPWNTNIIPRQMSGEELLAGIKWLCNRLYRPDAFGERMARFIDRFGAQRDDLEPEPQLRHHEIREIREVDIDTLDMVGQMLQSGSEERTMVLRIRKQLLKKPRATQLIIPMFVRYLQIRYMYERGGLWNPRLGSSPRPFLEA